MYDLAIIGSGGYTMRKSLITLEQRGDIRFDVEAGWKKITSDPGSIEKNWFGNPYRWWSDIMDLDPLPDFITLNIPIFIGIGELDNSVPVESAHYLESKFKEYGKSNLPLHQLCTSNDKPNLPCLLCKTYKLLAKR